MKIMFSATDESIRIEVDTAGHNQVVHDSRTLLTTEIKRRIKDLAKTLKPNAIRLKLLASYVPNFVIFMYVLGRFSRRSSAHLAPNSRPDCPNA